MVRKRWARAGTAPGTTWNRTPPSPNRSRNNCEKPSSPAGNSPAPVKNPPLPAPGRSPRRPPVPYRLPERKLWRFAAWFPLAQGISPLMPGNSPKRLPRLTPRRKPVLSGRKALPPSRSFVPRLRSPPPSRPPVPGPWPLSRFPLQASFRAVAPAGPRPLSRPPLSRDPAQPKPRAVALAGPRPPNRPPACASSAGTRFRRGPPPWSGQTPGFPAGRPTGSCRGCPARSRPAPEGRKRGGCVVLGVLR
jgi:hypothetical protein